MQRKPMPTRPTCILSATGPACFLAMALATLTAQAQAMPDIPSLLKDVEAHQAAMEKLRENYTYSEQTVTQELNKDGSVKKTDSEEDDVFFVNTHEIDRVVRKNGKPLSPDEEKKEQSKVMAAAEKAAKTPPGARAGGDNITVSRMLEIMKTSQPRRTTLDNRPTIAFDFTGDPHAKTHGRMEGASKKLTGTLWIDEQDRQVRRMTALFDDNFNIGFGLFTLAKGSSFTFDQRLVNSELWLPISAHVHVIGKAIAFFSYRGEIQITDGNYKRYHASATQVPAPAP